MKFKKALRVYDLFGISFKKNYTDKLIISVGLGFRDVYLCDATTYLSNLSFWMLGKPRAFCHLLLFPSENG
jgi:hypothetical protein